MKKSIRSTNPTDDAIKSITPQAVVHVPANREDLSPYSDIGKDVYWYVSGSKDGHPYADRRVAVFGGDVVISGSLKVEGCELTGSFNFDCDVLELTGSVQVDGFGFFTQGVSGSLTKLSDGTSYLVGGPNISVVTASNGSVSISMDMTSATTFPQGLSGSLTQLADGSPYLVSQSPGMIISTGSNGQILFSVTSGIQWNEKLTGESNGINSDFSLVYYPSSIEALMVFVNGILQEEGMTADFTLSGNIVSFSEPPRVGSKIVATYSRF